MKVCVITPIYYPHVHGGLESYAMELGHRLRAQGHEVAVIALGERDAHHPDSGHGEIYEIKRRAFRAFLAASHRPVEWLSTHLTEMFSGYGARATRLLIGRIKPDVIFSQAFYGFGRRMPGTLSGLGIPWIHYVHSYGLVCKRQTAIDNRGKPCVGQCADCKLICLFKNGATPLRDAITIYNSNHMRAFCEEAGMYSREVHVIDPSLGCDAPEISATYDPAAPFRLAYAGRISPEKGVHLLCDAVAAQPGRYRLEVLGAGPLLSELKARHSGDPITFHDRVEPQVRDAILVRQHALVVPSLWNEPFGRVVHEGFLAGLPVIVAGAGALGALVRHGVDGFVFNWKAGSELQSLTAALEAAVPTLTLLRAGAIETRERLLRQDNFTAIESLLTRAAARGALPVEAAGGAPP